MAASTLPGIARLRFQTAAPSCTPVFSAVIWGSVISVEV